MFCDGGLCSGEDCCWVDGVRCPHVEEGTVPGRLAACGLFRELGSWQAVHIDPRYVRDVKPMFDRLYPGFGCGDYPQNIPATRGQCCDREAS
jgi:hypothetical protein